MVVSLSNAFARQISGRSKPGLKRMTLLVALSAVALAQAPPRPAATAKPKQIHPWFQIGKASWYGRSFHGRRTATGERFNMDALTCAHRTLPLGTWVRVTNLANSRSTFLRVNDRGPVSPSLIVDLSYAAAQKLGIAGLGKVKLEPLGKDDPRTAAALTGSLQPIAAQPATVQLALGLPASPILTRSIAAR